MTKLRQGLIGTCISLGMLIICLLVAEMGWRLFFDSGHKLRQWHPELVLTNKPNVSWRIKKPEYTTNFRSNSHGYRGPELQLGPKRSSDELKVLFIGDSFTEALQVEEEERFVEQVGVQLSQALGRPVVSQAIAVAKTSPREHLLMYRNLGRQFEPDVVIQVLFPENDLMARSGAHTFTENADGSLELIDIWVDPAPACNWKCTVLRESKLAYQTYIMLRSLGAVKRDGQQINDQQMYTRSGQELFREQQRFAVLSSLVNVLRNEVEADGATFLTVLIPGAFEVQTTWQQQVQDQLSFVPAEEWNVPYLMNRTLTELAKINVQSLDLRQSFTAAQPDAEPLYYQQDPHLNPRGHNVAAPVLTEFIEYALR